MTNNTTTNPTTRAIGLLTDPDRDVRFRAATILGSTPDPAAAEALVERLGAESDLNVRETLTWAVVQNIGTALPRVLELLQSPEPAVRSQAAHVLSKVGDPAVAGHLGAVIADDDPEVAVKAYRAAAATGRPEVVDTLVARLSDGDTEQRDALSTALARLGEAAVPALTSALADPAADVREHAADALGHLGHPDADGSAEALGRLLADADEDVRLAAVSALGQLGGQVAADALTAATASDDQRVAGVARQLLAGPRPGAED
ncbi:HEAT repeat domain-containing protein [Nigerium massiliense]|uniref:HEAT repeat domain-containing protein n=1 Tax=Nigerium massiliense TaxID=1522317 RepID=UPI000693C76F|nr:HEAT repeat domain-containing protein [Nigerium massiliense]